MKQKISIQKITGNVLFPSTIVLIAVFILNLLLQNNFLSYTVFKSNLMTFSPLILISMAQAIIILTGSIDMSIGASVTVINVFLASVMTDSPGNILSVSLLALLIGGTISLVNGLFITYLELPSMIVTFATSAILRGLALIIMPQPGGYIAPTFYRLYLSSIWGIIPAPAILLVVSFLFWLMVKRRKIYRHIYAVGGNSTNAWSSGISIHKTKLTAFFFSGILSAIAGLAVTAQAASGDASLAHTYTLPSIAACVIGGISLQGGRGRITGAIMGALILSFLTNVIYFAKIPSLYQDLIKGVIILAALTIGVIPVLQRKLNNI